MAIACGCGGSIVRREQPIGILADLEADQAADSDHARVNVLVPFAGGNTEVTIALGDAGDIDEPISAVSVFTVCEP